MRGWSRLWLVTLVFGLGGVSTATCADEGRALSSGQSLYLPIYSHMIYGNIGRRTGTTSSILLSAQVSIRNTDPTRPLRVLSAKYYDTHGTLVSERVAAPITIPALGTLELFIDRNDASGGSGANFIIKWNAETPVNPPLVEALHANLDGGKAVVFLTQSTPIQHPAASPGQK